MTFQQIVADICGRMNLTSAEATARVGQSVNRHYRRVTATIGLEPIRYITRTGTTALNSDKVTFTGIEKIDRVFERAPDGQVLVLQPVMLAQLREGRELQGSRYAYAIWQQTASDITILLPGLALAITDLYADGWTKLADLAGTDEPAIPSSFHDILIFSVVAEEHLRKEKTDLADRFALQADTLLKELRFHQADAPAIDFRQGDHVIDSASGGGGGTGGGGSSVITGDIVFDRDPGPPFTVTAGSGKVDNLDADKLDGQHGPFYLDRANHTGPIPVAALPAHHTTHEPGGADALTALDAGILTTGTIPPARIADNSITDAKLADLPASNLLGRGSLAGTGDPQPISIGTGLSMAGTVLQTSGTVIAVPGGTDKQVQFNDAGLMAGDVALVFDKATQMVTTGAVTARQALLLDTVPSFVLKETVAPVDARVVRVAVTGQQLVIDALNDALTVIQSRVTLTRAAELTLRSLVINSGQITFPGTAELSSSPNVLDDYREGTWTPTLTGNGGGSGQSYALQSGAYTKVGNLVVCSGRIQLSSKGTIAGVPQIGGWPFPAKNTNHNSMGTLQFGGLAAGVAGLLLALVAGTITANLLYVPAAGNTGHAYLDATQLTNAFDISFSVSYQTT